MLEHSSASLLAVHDISQQLAVYTIPLCIRYHIYSSFTNFELWQVNFHKLFDIYCVYVYIVWLSVLLSKPILQVANFTFIASWIVHYLSQKNNKYSAATKWHNNKWLNMVSKF